MRLSQKIHMKIFSCHCQILGPETRIEYIKVTYWWTPSCRRFEVCNSQLPACSRRAPPCPGPPRDESSKNRFRRRQMCGCEAKIPPFLQLKMETSIGSESHGAATRRDDAMLAQSRPQYRPMQAQGLQCNEMQCNAMHTPRVSLDLTL